MPQPVTINLEDLYRPQKKQAAFHASGALHRLQVGGAGSGKSMAMLWEAVRWCFTYPGIRVLLLRRNFPELEKGLIADLHATVPRELYRWNDSKHIATFLSPDGGAPSTISFGHLENDRETDLRQYLSSAYPLIGIDELGQFGFSAWEFMDSRTRLNPGCRPDANGDYPRPGIMAATNPLGPGWEWIKALFIDHKLPSEAEGDEGTSFRYNPEDYWYIHSTVLDNDALLAKDPGYLARLQRLSPARRKKFLHGDLDSVSGQYFLCFDPEVHVVPASALEWQPWERAWIGLDWGLAHWTSVLWFTRAKHRALGKSVTVCYRERQFRELSVDDAASLIRGASAGPPAFPTFSAERRALSSVFASHELFARRASPQSSQTIAAEFSRALGKYGMPGLVRASGSASKSERIRGAIMVYEDIANKDFFVLDSCPNLARAIPSLIRDDTDIDDVRKSDTRADDIFDSLKHGILSVSAPRSEPEEHRAQEQAEKIEDPLQRWLFLTKQKSKKWGQAGPIPAVAPLWQRRLG